MDMLEMTVSRNPDSRFDRTIRRLKLFRMLLIVCLAMAWIYGFSVAAAVLADASGAATLWSLYFVMYTIPAGVVLILVCHAIARLTREYDYVLTDEALDIFVSTNGTKRKLLIHIDRSNMQSFGKAEDMPSADKMIRAACGNHDLWGLDIRRNGSKVRVLLQPNEIFRRKLAAYVK